MAVAATVDEIFTRICSSRTLDRESLGMLYFVYQRNLERAVSILDREGVKRISGEQSQRSVYLVHGETKKSEEHLCSPSNYFCSCQAFFYDVVVRDQYLNCKHQLAARLAQALGTCTEETVSDEELAILLLAKRSKRNRRQVQYVLKNLRKKKDGRTNLCESSASGH